MSRGKSSRSNGKVISVERFDGEEMAGVDHTRDCHLNGIERQVESPHHQKHTHGDPDEKTCIGEFQ